MLLYHFSPGWNDDRILSNGLLSLGASGRVWFVRPSRFSWAYQHLGRHHQCKPVGFSVYRVSIPRCRCFRVRRGVWASVFPVARSELFPIILAGKEVSNGH